MIFVLLQVHLSLLVRKKAVRRRIPAVSLRICLLSKQFHPAGGGSERYAHVLAHALAQRGHTVDVYTLGSLKTGNAYPSHQNVTVTFLGKRRRPLVTLETLYYSILARTSIDFHQYDIIHGTLMPASPVALTVNPPSPPLVVTNHAFSLAEVWSHKLEVPTDYLKKLVFHPMNALMDAATAQRVTRVIAISSIDCEYLKRVYRIPEEKLVHVPHGVDVTHFSPRASEHPAVDPDRFTLLHVGRLVSRKHVDLAIEGLAMTKRGDVELLIAGSGRHRDRLEVRTQELGVTDQVHFLGFIPEERLPSIYASSDAFMFLPRYEGFGLTFLEAMASGTPVIGTPVGGFPDMVTDGKDGQIVDHDATDVAHAINKLANNPDLATEMGVRARGLAEGRTWDDVAVDTEAVYQAVVREIE